MGPYEIVEPIGAGGMGEVYRGRDTRLDRSVAIKILASELSARAEIRDRFEREARAISSLAHAHICTLFDVGQENGTDYLVMEYLEGETLAAKIGRGPLPIDQVLRYGTEIAEALATAHKHGIVHRDLKPGNVIITKAGVKLLDFGLAKIREAVQEKNDPAGLTSFRTEQRALTEEGTILGTFQYMAPEQLEGVETDARSDIFALGAVLYEMTTGRRAFEGKTKTSLIAAIIDRDPPPLSTLQPLAPPALERVIRTCLAKNPDDRWQSAHDVAAELRWIGEAGSQAGVAAPVVVRRKRRESIAWSVAAASLIAASILGLQLYREKQTPAETLEAAILPPHGSEFTFTSGPMAVSPDGRKLAFIAQTATGENALWVRPLGSGGSQQLAGTADAAYPFWSADSRQIAFFAGGKLRKIDAGGGPPQTICEAANARGGTWSRENVILFAMVRDAIYHVPASGGSPKKVTSIDSAAGEADHRWPFILPDGKHFLFLARAEDPEESNIWVGELGSAQRKRLTQSSGNPMYAGGFLLFTRERTLLAQPFNAGSQTMTGDPVPVAEQITYIPGTAAAIYSISASGLLAYTQGSAQAQLVWYSRDGKETGRVGTPGNYGDVSLSPDGHYLAIDMADANGKADIWIHDLTRATASRFTFKPIDEFAAVWSPDGQQIAFAVGPKRPAFDIALKPARASGVEQILWEETESQRVPADWSRDGQILVSFHNPKRKVVNDIWIYSIKDRKGTPLVQSSFSEFPGNFSPDGAWFVYTSNESGKSEVYAMPVGRPGKWQVSPNGGVAPLWSRKGDEIFYLTLDRKLMAVPVHAGNTLDAGDPKLLFETHIRPDPGKPYDVSADGQRFIVANSNESSMLAPITIVANWGERLKR